MGGFPKILRNLWGGFRKILHLLTRWVGVSKKGQKHAYVIYEGSLATVCERIFNKIEKYINKIHGG